MNDTLDDMVAPERVEILPTESAGRAQLTNMQLALSTLLAAQDAGDGRPHLCMMYGYSGYGKSVAAAYVTSLTNAVYIEAKSVWTPLSILKAIAAELGIAKPKRTAYDLFLQVVEAFNADPVPLIIDEMDHLTSTAKVELIRDIHDKTRMPIMLIGMEGLPAQLKQWEQFDNRIIAATAAQPASVEDARKLREHYCRRVDVTDDLLAHIVKESGGGVRRIVVNLSRVQAEAIDQGRDSADLGWWQRNGKQLLTGAIATRRRNG